MTLFYLASLLCLISSILSGYFMVKGKGGLRLVFKLIASIMFFLGAVIASVYTSSDSTYAVWVLVALLFGLLGDVFLCMNNLVLPSYKTLFSALGVATFFIGHLFFASIFLSMAPFRWFIPLIVLAFPLGVWILTKAKIVSADKISPFHMLYAGVLALMLVSVINLYIHSPSKMTAIILSAGILFTVSDTCLLIRDFGKSEKVRTPLRFVVLITYYTAQLLFASSIFFY